MAKLCPTLDAQVHVDKLLACPYCDLLQHDAEVPPRGVLRCRRCFAELYRNRRNSMDRSLALCLASAQVFVIANAYPLVTMRVQGDSRSTSLPRAVWSLYQHGMQPLAVLVFLTTILAPAVEIGAILMLLLSLRLQRGQSHFAPLFRFVQSIRRWGMIDVLMLGVLVSLVKLAQLAEVVPGIALWAFAALLLLLVALGASFNARDVWRWSAERHA